MRIYEDEGYHASRKISRRIRPVAKVQKIEKVKKRKRYQERRQQREDIHQKRKLPDETLRHFDELELEVEELQERLIEENRPFRVRIYTRETQVLLDVYRFSSQMKPQLIATRDITDGDFTDWAKVIMEGEGILFNMEG